MAKTKQKGPKVLIFDIETAPILAYVWGLWENNVALNQIKSDWHVMSWAAKWLDEPSSKVMYADQRNQKDISDDKKILKQLWDLLDEADAVVTQNGKSFDEKKLNARFIVHGFKPPSPYKHIDTCRIAKSKFGFTSNKLEYLAETLGVAHKKSSHKKFPGQALWNECLAKNKEAWKEMEKYNKLDVLATEEVYKKLQPWDNSLNNNLYISSSEPLECPSCQSTNLKNNGKEQTKEGTRFKKKCRDCGKAHSRRQDGTLIDNSTVPEIGDTKNFICSCGKQKMQKRGITVRATGKYQLYSCGACGAYYRGRTNLMTKEQKKNLLVKA